MYYPAAAFNELRRKGLEEHSKKRRAHFRPGSAPERKDMGKWPEKYVSYRNNIANERAAQFYLSHGVEHIDKDSLLAENVPEARLMTTKYCVRSQLGMCPKKQGHDVCNAAPLYMNDNTGEYELRFDCRRCEMQVIFMKS